MKKSGSDSESTDELKVIQETLGDTFVEVSPRVYRSGKILVMHSFVTDSWILQTDSKIFKNQVRPFNSLENLIVFYLKMGEENVPNEEVSE